MADGPRPQDGYNPVQTALPDVQQPNDAIRTEATGADFGAQVGGALQQVGQTGERAAGQAMDVATAIQDRHNRVAADQGFNNLQDANNKLLYGDPANPDDHGYLGLTGADALNKRAQMMTQLEANRTQILNSGLDNDAQRLLFDQSSRRLNSMAMSQIGAHAEQQWGAWSQQTQAAGQDIALKSLGSDPTNEALFQNNLEQGLTATAKKSALAGESPASSTAAQLDFTSKAFSTRAVALGALDPVAAYQFVRDNEAKMDGPTFATLSERLRPKADAVKAQGIINGVVPLPAAAALGPGASAVQSEAVAQGVDPIQAQTVAQIETGGGAKPDRPGSQYRGIFQLGTAEFAQNGGTQRGDMADEAKAGVANLKRIQPLADAAVGGTAAPWQVYMVHQQGDAGGTALLKADPAQNVVDALAPAYGGDRRTATAAIAQNGGDPNGTVGDFTSHWQQTYAATEQKVRGAAMTTGPQPYPDLPGLEQKVLAQTAGDPDLQREAISQLHQRMALVNVQVEQARQELSHTLAGTNAALLSGDSTVTIPEQTIRAAYPAPEADRIVTDMNVAKQAGQLIKGLKFASPDQVAATMADLSTPDGRAGTMLRTADATNRAAPGVAVTPDANALPPETPDQTLRRQQIQRAAQQALEDRNKALQSDPASYVAGEPNVKAAAAAIDDKNPETFAAYARASQAAQRTLGVADGDTRVLGAPQASAIVKGLMTADPEKTDVGAELDRMATKYGDAWPKVFGDLARAKLPGSYQVLANMDQPSQAAARTDLQTALQQSQKLGSIGKYRATLPQDQARAVDAALDQDLSQFQATTQHNSGGQALYATVRDATKLLAYSYVARQGRDGATASAEAAQSIVGERYDFDGSMRVPKGTMDQVHAATRNVLAGLKPTDLAAFPGDSAITPEQRQGIELDAARRGQWVPNADETGLQLMGLRRNGLGPVRWNDGHPVEIHFADLSHLATPPPSALPMAQTDNPGAQMAGP